MAVTTDWHWRNTMKTVRFFIFDARAGFFVVLVLVHARMWTLMLAILVMSTFYLLERKSLTFPAALRSLRVWLIGSYRPGWIWSRRRKLIDTGSR
ncbi:MAG: type IV secretion protein IcmT [Alphaproteobacteria bacterium]|nr:type IV secretion protein IcmT [Alphaproteobacteria bacterium]